MRVLYMIIGLTRIEASFGFVGCAIPPFRRPSVDLRKSMCSVQSSRLYDQVAPATQNIEALNEALESMSQIKNVKCKVGPSSSGFRFGLIATQNIRRGDTVISVPNDFCLTGKKARKVFSELGCINEKKYDGWTGDLGLIALLLLRERAKLDPSYDDSFVSKEDASKKDLFREWASSLPSIAELSDCDGAHPLMWNEDDHEILQSSSTKKIYKVLDDFDEDATWWQEKIWSKNRRLFPEKDNLGQPCFTIEGFKWALAISMSRTYFVDGELKLCPIVDFANHNDFDALEVNAGFFGTFGTTAGVQIKADKSYKPGEEVFVSYGPKSAAEYLIEHGFIPQSTKTTSVAELTFEIEESDRFFDDKLDVLEFETGGSSLEPVQSFDVVSAPGRDGQPDPALIQFVRLSELSGKDAFLLESIFRKEIWDFMASPVSENNERAVFDTILSTCASSINEMNEISREEEDNNMIEDEGKPKNQRSCAIIRNVERRAISTAEDYLAREGEALDLKEYYQERRLKDLGLDSPWDGDERNPDVGWGSRKPGDGGIDW